MITIKILGPGCANCQKLEAIVHQVVDKMSVAAEVTKVTDYNEMGSYGITATPGLVINEKLVSSGRIPTSADVMTWISDVQSRT